MISLVLILIENGFKKHLARWPSSSKMTKREREREKEREREREAIVAESASDRLVTVGQLDSPLDPN